MNDHHPINSQSGKPNQPVRLRPSRLGAALFGLYLALYSAFVLVNAFSPSSMDWTPLAGVNLAILSGLGLIVIAFLLALIFDWLGDREGGR